MYEKTPFPSNIMYLFEVTWALWANNAKIEMSGILVAGYFQEKGLVSGIYFLSVGAWI